MVRDHHRHVHLGGFVHDVQDSGLLLDLASVCVLTDDVPPVDVNGDHVVEDLRMCHRDYSSRWWLLQTLAGVALEELQCM